MGRSRRRASKFRVKVSRKPKRKTFTRSDLPGDVLKSKPDIEAKLGRRPSWDTERRPEANYVANRLMVDPNTGFGRNCRARASQEGAEAMAVETSQACESDDDLRQYEGKPRRDGKRAIVAKPTAQQHRIIEGLLKAHGDDIEAMVKDTKLNRMLLPASKLKRLIQGYKLYGDKGRCSFRAPIKSL